MLLNNICEVFNECILDVREKPIIGSLEGVRVYLMNRQQQNREKVKKRDGLLCPKIQKLIEKYKVEASSCLPRWE